jgi:diguanylate cyclase (GGDEF)-like protein
MVQQVTVQGLQSYLSFLGSFLQFGSSVLLISLFLLLRPYARRRKYFNTWAFAWIALSIALAMVMFRYNILPVLSDAPLRDDDPSIRVMFFFYQLAKVAFYGLLVAGALQYVGKTPGVSARTTYVVFALIFTAVSVSFSRHLGSIVIWQAPIAVAMLGYGAVLLLSLPGSRRSVGNALAGSCFAFGSAVWLLFILAFSLAGTGNPLRPIIHFNTYLDLLWNVALGFGMVVMLMEDAKTEVDAAHAELHAAHDSLRRASFYDSVTGSLNRQAFAEGLGLDAARTGFGAVVMLDMDNLKNINDQFGHAAGDRMLRHIVDVLRSELRAGDKLYRWGGDEFLLVFPAAHAADVGRRMKSTLANADVLYLTDGTELDVRVSVGAAAYTSAEHLYKAIEAADVAMYEDKVARKSAAEVDVVQSV